MKYGPTSSPTASVLAVDGDGESRLFWDCGVEPNLRVPLPRLAKVQVDLETPEGLSASALFPSGTSRRLVNDPGRELVLEHFATLQGQALQTSVAVHLWTEQRGDGLVVCTVLVSCGACDPAVAGSWLGGVRFRKVRLRVLSPGWLSTGCDFGPEGDWYLGMGSAFSRRFVLYPAGDAGAAARAEALASLADLQQPSPFPGLGPGAFVLPRSIATQQNRLWDNAATLGPLHFDSNVTNGYEAGGARILPLPGYEVSPEAARTYAADVTRVLSRGGVARSRSDNGRPIYPEEWPSRGTYVLTDNRWCVDPWNWPGQAGTLVGAFGWNRGNDSPSLCKFRDVNPGPSSAARELVRQYQWHDSAHLIRARVAGAGAWYLCRDWAARQLVAWTAADVMSSWTPWALEARVAAAEGAPGRGAEYARELAWVAGAVADELSVTTDEGDRARLLHWRELFLRYVSAACLPNGFIRSGGPGSDNNVPWQEGLPAWASAAAWFQVALFGCGLFDLWTAGPGATAQVSRERLEWLMSEALLQALDNRGCPLAAGAQPRDYYGPARAPAAGGLPTEPELPVVDATPGGSYSNGHGGGHAIHDWTHLALWRRVWTGARQMRPTPEQLAVTIGPAAGRQLDDVVRSWVSSPDCWNVIPAAYL